MEKDKKFSLGFNFRTIIVLLIDIIILTASFFFTTLVFGYDVEKYAWNLLIMGVICAVVFIINKLSMSIWRYASFSEINKLFWSTLASTALYVLISYFIFPTGEHFRFSVIYALVYSYALIASRIIYCLYYRVVNKVTKLEKKRVAIVGAGYAGIAVVRNIKIMKKNCYTPVCFFDDDPAKINRFVNGVKVVGNIDSIQEYCKEHKIDIIIIAISEMTNSQQERLYHAVSLTDCQVKRIPILEDLLSEDKPRDIKMEDIKIEDLLGRQTITVDETGMVKESLKDKVVMVTGGGGSIGSELCRQAAKCDVKKLIILDIYENNAYDIQQELIREYGDKLDLHVEIASVRDVNKMDEIIGFYKPQIIYHAAAHKHVPLMETNPEEAVKNNIFGTYNVAMMADKHKVEKMVFISTDKAVNPTNVMGATKRFCEMIIQSMKEISNTKYAAVRFGNVLGSNGSVIPLFKAQIAKGGPVTVTDKRIIRYFMTIPEAVQLVMTAGIAAENGTVFVLDMGRPVKIDDLARRMIMLAGYIPDKDIKIEYTGLRPGEKMYEELLVDKDDVKTAVQDKIFVEDLEEVKRSDVEKALQEFSEVLKTRDKMLVVNTIAKYVKTFTYTPNDKKVVNVKEEVKQA